MLILLLVLVVKTGFGLLRLFFEIGVGGEGFEFDGLNRFVLELHLSLESRVESIFDVVVCSPWQKFRDFAPFVTVLFVSLDDGSIFISGPFVFLDVWVQVIVPALATLLADSSW